MTAPIVVRRRDGWWVVRTQSTVGYFRDWPAAIDFTHTLQERGKRMGWVSRDGLTAWVPDEPGIRCSCGDATLPDLAHSADGCVETDPRPVEVGGE